MMANSDPMIFAARAGRMSDNELYQIFHAIVADEGVDDFQRAVLDEAQIRGMLTSSEVDTFAIPSPARD